MAVIIRPNVSFALDATVALDAGVPSSYPGSGNTWYDTSQTRGDNATLYNTSYTTLNGYGILNFNGSSSYAEVLNRNWNFNFGQTIMMAFQPLESDGNRRNPYNQAYGGGGTWTHEPGNNINFYFGNSGVDGGSYIGFGSGFTVVQNEWAIVATTRNQTNAYWYKNGILINGTSHGYTTVNTGTRPILVGRGYAGYYLGNIGFCYVWDRALSDTEVKTYYDRLKSRYGLS